MKREKLEKLDLVIYDFLEHNIDIMPKRFVKFIAYFYTDARIRKRYWEKLNVFMDKGTYANIGFMAVNNSETSVTIGKNVSIAPNVTLITDASANNGIEINEIAYVKEVITKEASIIIEDEVWIGANVTILPGVRVGKCSVIGAGSVVLSDVEPYSIYAGVPARKIRDLKTGEAIKSDK